MAWKGKGGAMQFPLHDSPLKVNRNAPLIKRWATRCVLSASAFARFYYVRTEYHPQGLKRFALDAARCRFVPAWIGFSFQ